MFSKTLLKIPFAVFVRETVYTAEECDGFDCLVGAFAWFYARLWPVGDENTIAMVVYFRILVDDNIGANHGRAVRTRDHGEATPRLHAGTKVVVMHQVNGIWPAFRAKRTLDCVTIIVL